MNTRLPKNKLLIGAYFLHPYAQTEKHVKELSECGIEMIVCFDPKDREILDILHKYGVGCIVEGVLPHWWGGDGSKAGTMGTLHPLSLYEKAAEEFVDHPAIWGIDLCDEPSAHDFDHLGRAAELIDKKLPNQFAYLNLYPNYAAVSQNDGNQTVNQLGTPTYEEHIEKYLEKVALPYISYDFYLYPQTKNHNVGKMLDNFRIVSDACLRSGRDFWYIPMANGRYEDSFTSLNRMRYQAYIALAYGATVINWACYTAGWWFNQILDNEGNKTEQYDKLKTMNRELHAISDVYMAHRRVSTHLIGFKDESWEKDFPLVVPKESLDCGFARGLSAGGASLVIGEMVHREDANKRALFICNASDPMDENNSTATVSFTSFGKKVSLHSGEGEIELSRDGDRYSFELQSNHAVMITFE